MTTLGTTFKMTMTEAALAQRRRNVAVLAARRRAETTCQRGHEFTPENTRVLPGGRRECRLCDRDRTRYRRLGLSIKDFA